MSPVSSDRVARAYRGDDRRSFADAAAIQYRGPDRRGPAARGAEPFGVRYGVFAFGALLLAVIAIRATFIGGRGQLVAFTALRDSGAGLLVLAGTVLLVVWALTGQAARALDGAALLLVGGGLLVLAGPWGALLHTSQTAVLVSPLCRLALGLPALVLLIRSPSVLPVDSSIRPMTTLATAAAWTLGLLGVEAVIRVWGPIDDSAVLASALGVLAVGWSTAGMRRVTSRNSAAASAGDRAMGWAMITYAAGDILLAVTFLTNMRWGVIGVAFQLLGAGLAAWVAVSWLLAILSRDGTRKLWLVGELADVTTVLADEQSIRNKLLHDARNVVAAIDTATVTLARHGHRLEPAVQEQLRGAVGSEFARLQVLLDPTQDPARKSSKQQVLKQSSSKS
jgi:hypothetical protein